MFKHYASFLLLAMLTCLLDKFVVNAYKTLIKGDTKLGRRDKLQRIQGILTIVQGVCFYSAAVCWLIFIDFSDYDIKLNRNLILAWHLHGIAQIYIAHLT